MPVELELDQERWQLDPLEVEEEVRAGRLPRHAWVRYPPWTGAERLQVDAVEALRDARDAPAACVAHRMGQRPAPLAMLGFTAALVLLCIAQTYATATIPGVSERLIRNTAMGLSTTLLDGHWWTVWTAHLVHAPAYPLAHLTANMAFLLYSGFRVERLLGSVGYVAVVAGAAAGAALLVVGAAQPPTIGSSTLAFGLWAAQVGAGLRWADALPAALRRRYGFASLIVVAPLLALNLPVKGVSHLGHLGGALGGLAVALLAPVVGAQAAANQARVRRRLWGLSALLLLAPAAAVTAIAHLGPSRLLWQQTVVAIHGSDATLRLPAGMAESRVSLWGLPGWRASDLDASGLAAVEWIAGGFAPATQDERTAWWSERTLHDARPTPPPPPLRDGWQAMAWTLSSDGAAPTYVVENTLSRGHYRLRITWLLDRPPDGAGRLRDRFYRSLASTLTLGDPEGIAALRQAYARNPQGGQPAFRLAEALYTLGDIPAAESIVAGLLARQDGWQWDAARLRLQELTAEPGAWPAAPSPDWLAPFLAEAPLGDRGIHVTGVAWLARSGHCGLALAHLAELQARSGADDPPAGVDAAASPCAPPPD